MNDAQYVAVVDSASASISRSALSASSIATASAGPSSNANQQRSAACVSPSCGSNCHCDHRDPNATPNEGAVEAANRETEDGAVRLLVQSSRSGSRSSISACYHSAEMTQSNVAPPDDSQTIDSSEANIGAYADSSKRNFQPRSGRFILARSARLSSSSDIEIGSSKATKRTKTQKRIARAIVVVSFLLLSMSVALVVITLTLSTHIDAMIRRNIYGTDNPPRSIQRANVTIASASIFAS